MMKKYKEFCDKINDLISNNELNIFENFISYNGDIFEVLAVLCFLFSVILVPFSIAYGICLYFLIPCFVCAVFLAVVLSYVDKKTTTIKKGISNLFNEFYGDYEDKYLKEKFSIILTDLKNDIKNEIKENKLGGEKIAFIFFVYIISLIAAGIIGDHIYVHDTDNLIEEVE
jgi:hypothetical protein